MAEEDFARALHEAVQTGIQEMERSGQTSPPPRFWHDIKGQLARDFPREFQHAIDVSIWYNSGVFDENVFDEHLDHVRSGYKDRLENQSIEME